MTGAEVGDVPPAGRGQATAAVLAVLVMLAGGTWLACSRPWAPVSDLAIIETQVHDVGRHTPFLGSYSRFGFKNLGPWMLWLLAAPYRASGSSPNGLLVGAAVINAVAVVGIARVARRRGGLPLLLGTLAAVALLMRALGLALLVSPWNPDLPLLPFTWLLFLVWDAACGQAWSIPLALAVGSFVAQCHISYAGATVALLAWGVGVGLVARRRRAGPSLASLAAVTAAIAAACWLPAAVEQMTNDPGNLRLLYHFFVHPKPGGPPALGAHRGALVLARELAGRAPWMGGEEPTFMDAVVPLPAWWLLGPGLAAVTAAVLARRRGAHDAVRGVVTAGVAAGVSWAVLTRIVGFPYAYLVHWTWAIGLFLDVTVLWALARGLAPAAGRVPAGVAAAAGWAAVAALLALSALTLTRDRDAELPGDAYLRSMQALTPPVLAWVRERAAHSVLLEPNWPGPVYAGLVAALDRTGVDIAVPDRLSEFPRHRHAAGRAFDERLVVSSGGAIARSSARGDATRLASYEPTTEIERRSKVRPVAVFAVPAGARLPEPNAELPEVTDAPHGSAAPSNTP